VPIVLLVLLAIEWHHLLPREAKKNLVEYRCTEMDICTDLPLNSGI
jgi:hypothetical protein